MDGNDGRRQNKWSHILDTPGANERQRNINDSWLCILGNLEGKRLQIFINEVLAAFMCKRERETLPASSSKRVSMECQWLLAFHYD